MQDAAAKVVARDIHAYKERWERKAAEERTEALVQASAWATRQEGHRVKCPACGSPALVQGSPQGAVRTDIAEDMVVQRQMMVPSLFECIACGLKISGLSKLSAAGLGDAYTATSTSSVAEFFGLYTHEDLEEARGAAEPQWEEDFNE
jgi:DNA-directed RNA polymerase subunit RPC12/RpoP